MSRPLRGRDPIVTDPDEEGRAAGRTDVTSVLLIEDDPADSLLFEESLTHFGSAIEVTVATRVEAIDELGTDFDCVVLDLGLPGMVGLEAIHAVRTAMGDAAIVVLTGWGNDDAGLAAVVAGAQDYLVKGEAGPDSIVRSIRFAIERRRGQQATAELLVAEARHVEQERLERALLGAPALSRRDLAWDSRYSAARSGLVSGDFVDCVELGDGTVRAVIGDVAGHDADEAALGVALRVAWRSLALSMAPDADLFANLERLLISERRASDDFATVCELVISADLRQVRVRLAGHPAPLLAGVGALRDEQRRSPLGVRLGERRWPGTVHPLPPGFSLAMFTDGLYEVRSSDGRVQDASAVEAQLAGAVDDRGRIRPERLMAAMDDQSSGGWRDDVAIAVISDASDGS